MNNALAGAGIGGLIGAAAGLGICVWLIEGPWIFPGDTVAIGAVLGLVVGYLGGEGGVDFLKELLRQWFHWGP